MWATTALTDPELERVRELRAWMDDQYRRQNEGVTDEQDRDT